MVLLSLSRSALRQSASSLKKTSIFSSVNVTRSMSTASPWAHFEMAPLDPIIGLNESFAADDFPQKVIVGVGAYRDDSGKPYVLPCVREAEKIMMTKNLDMEYAGIVSIGITVKRKESYWWVTRRSSCVFRDIAFRPVMPSLLILPLNLDMEKTWPR